MLCPHAMTMDDDDRFDRGQHLDELVDPAYPIAPVYSLKYGQPNVIDLPNL